MAFNEADPLFDTALIEAAMALAAEHGWHGFTLVDAALEAGLSLDEVKKRYPFKSFLLISLNNLADKAMLYEVDTATPLKETLFNLFMRRFDAFQDYREGLRAVMHILPRTPALTALLGIATGNTIRWIADTAGLNRYGLKGAIRLQTLLFIWTQTLNVWEKDTTPELEHTMQALSEALDRAERLKLLTPLSRKQHIFPSTTGGLSDYHEYESE